MLKLLIEANTGAKIFSPDINCPFSPGKRKEGSASPKSKPFKKNLVNTIGDPLSVCQKDGDDT